MFAFPLIYTYLGAQAFWTAVMNYPAQIMQAAMANDAAK